PARQDPRHQDVLPRRQGRKEGRRPVGLSQPVQGGRQQEVATDHLAARPEPRDLARTRARSRPIGAAAGRPGTGGGRRRGARRGAHPPPPSLTRTRTPFSPPPPPPPPSPR